MTVRVQCLLVLLFNALLLGALALVALAQNGAPVNYASAAAGATVAGPQNASGSQGQPSMVNDEEVLDYGPNAGYAWAYLDIPLTVTLAEPRSINKIEILFLDIDARTYRYRLEVSADGQAFETVADCTREPHRGWQTHLLETRPVKAIRVTVTGTSVEARSYHIVELAAWHQAWPAEPSPLRKKFDGRAARLAQQRQARAKIIDLERMVAAVFGNEEVMRLVRAQDEEVTLKLDTDQDGDPDILAWREGKNVIAGLDEDDDMAPDDTRPDTDSDCWVADYHGDGEIDRAIDYLDLDGDADASVLYLLTSNLWSPHDMTCVVIGDRDDDNRMWYLRNYEYDQGACQWQCDFSGNEFFSMGHYDATQGRWISWLENPFCFYDLDGDGDSEAAVRYSGRDLVLRSLRYSFDLDNDATSESLYDYDFSITALGNVQVPDELAATFPLRGGGELTYVAWEHGREVAEWAPWNRAELCWDENDNNVNPYGDERVRERWEGVIASGSEHFPQEGGPSCGPFNKRYEIDNDFSGRLGLYYSGIDQRFHLRGAEFGWLDADYNNDGKVDLRFRYEDTDGNGFFDRWHIDSDGDGRWDWSETMADEQVRLVPWDYKEMHRLFTGCLSAARIEQEGRLKMLREHTGGQESDVERYWREGLPGFYAAEKVRSSLEGQRYYYDLILARSATLLDPFPLSPGVARPAPTVKLKLTNPLPLDRTAEPVVIPLSELPEVHLTPTQPFVAVHDGEKILPAQADDLDGDGVFDELVFLIDLAARETRVVTLLENPPRPPAVEKRTATNLHMGASLGWESDRVAYRTYYGKIDVFGKKGSLLKLRELKGAYHQEADWGMDILHLGPSAGVGGLYLWAEEQPLPAMNEEGQPEKVKITKRVIVDGPLRSMVEVELAGLQTPQGMLNLTRRFSIYAAGEHTEEQLTITGGEGGKLIYSPGLIKIEGAQGGQGVATGKAGKGLTYLWNWGKQNHPDVADAGEIGLALLVPTANLVDVKETGPDHVLRCHFRKGVPQRHYLVAGWAKGRRHSNAEAWRTFIATLAQRLAAPVEWKRPGENEE